MRSFFTILLLAVSYSSSPAQIKPEILAQGAGENWLKDVDGEHFGESWDQASDVFKRAVTRDAWIANVGSARRKLGVLKSRVSQSVRYTQELPGAPPGDYVVLQYDTSFGSLPASVESIILAKEADGSWKVAAYFVKPKG